MSWHLKRMTDLSQTPAIISSRLLTPSGNLTKQTTLIIEHDDSVDPSEIQYPESVSKDLVFLTNLPILFLMKQYLNLSLGKLMLA